LLCFPIDHSQVNESAPAKTVEDAAAVSAVSKQQILVQYLKVHFSCIAFLCLLLVLLFLKCHSAIEIVLRLCFPAMYHDVAISQVCCDCRTPWHLSAKLMT